MSRFLGWDKMYLLETYGNFEKQSANLFGGGKTEFLQKVNISVRSCVFCHVLSHGREKGTFVSPCLFSL